MKLKQLGIDNKTLVFFTSDNGALPACDLFHTFYTLSGIKLPEGFSFDGKDRSNILRDKSSLEKRIIFWENGRKNTSFVYPAGKDRSRNLATKKVNWKLLINSDGSDIQLYDLEKDRAEVNDVKKENQNVAGSMKQRLSD